MTNSKEVLVVRYVRYVMLRTVVRLENNKR